MSFKVLGVGDNVADYYKHINTIYPGGCSFNFSAYARMLNVEAGYLGIIGNDFAGRHIMSVADELGIDTTRCKIMNGTTVMPAVEIRDGERFFVGQNEHGVFENQLLLTPRDLSYISEFSLIHTNLYAKMEQNLELLSDTGVPIAFDFGATYSDMYCKAQCSHVTYAIMSCAHLSMDEMYNHIHKLHQFGTPFVLATRGIEGSWFSDGHDIYHREANYVPAVDTNGAGDSFLTAFLCSFEKWRKESPAAGPEEKKSEILKALDAGSAFSGKTVLLNGSFGYGVEYQEDIIID